MKKFIHKILYAIFEIVNSYLIFFILCFISLIRSFGKEGIITTIINAAVAAAFCLVICMLGLYIISQNEKKEFEERKKRLDLFEQNKKSDSKNKKEEQITDK